MPTYLKFKGKIEPCIQYALIESNIVEYDDVVFNAYVTCSRIAVLGLVPTELLEEATHTDNANAIDVAIELSNQ